ncbi:hypothetical protein BD626DRAFT_491002 [Schizophyllum amplum]|uniref:F-box domain-containing protein n=1 Tax=Schizophyllum amplum TaxID=97359 RepID=A0A550CK39_9AGAR|nr:hypothetical protein BD626DRAFT_491002 [Auriculariopsis ampla]
MYILPSLPFELLALILQACVDTETETPASFFHDTTKAPCLLTQVCRKWRLATYQIPRFWTLVRVSVDALATSEERTATSAAFLADYLERSQPLPISVSIFSEDIFPDSILRPLLATAMRWQDLFLFVHPDDLARLTPIRGRLPQLQSLKITPTLLGTPNLAPPTMFDLAPTLTSVTLGGFALELRFVLPWAQLRAFEANYTASADILPLVQLMPALERLKLGREPPAPPNARAWQVTHTAVRSLTLNAVEDRDEPALHGDDMADCLTLPALVELEVECPSEARLERAREMIARSGCELQALTLVITFPCAANLTQLFRLTPALRELTIFDGATMTNDHLLDALVVCPENAGRQMLPKLENITLLASRPLEEKDVQRWLSAFESRVHPRKDFGEPLDEQDPPEGRVSEGESEQSSNSISALRSILMGCTSGEQIIDNELSLRRFHRIMHAGVKVDLWHGPDLF